MPTTAIAALRAASRYTAGGKARHDHPCNLRSVSLVTFVISAIFAILAILANHAMYLAQFGT